MPFTHINKELLSKNYIKDYSSRYNSEPEESLYLSAGLYLNGSEKEGNALDTNLSDLCYINTKNAFNNFIEENRIFTARFWKLEYETTQNNKPYSSILF